MSASPEFVTEIAAPKRGARRRALEGPNSNTGLNPRTPSGEAFALAVDWCTFVFPLALAQAQGIETVQDAVKWLFPMSPLSVTSLEAKRWQFYEESAYILGPDGKLVGRVGVGNGDACCVSLTGAGCSLVDDWYCTVVQARRVMARLTRVDLAFDDFNATLFRDIRDVNEWAKSGEFDAKVGRPAETKFMDDHRKGKGSTVYVGNRGRKMLCVYEKGKQLGDRESPWIRCELRLWANDQVLSLDLLTEPLTYMRGAYDKLALLLPQAVRDAKPERIARTVSATAEAAVRFLSNQCGPTLDLLVRALGPDVWTLLQERVLRSEVPRRFKGVARSLTDLRTIVREQLGYSRTDSMTVVAA